MYQRISLNLFFISVFLLGFITLTISLRDFERKPLIESLRVVMPAYMQTVFSIGDRYLAANIGVTRAMAFEDIRALPEDFAVQAKIQQQAQILNPRQEDNYYLAASVLSWEGQTKKANEILYTAGEARHWDPMPFFFNAFNLYYFDLNNIAAGKVLEHAAERADENNKLALKRMAAKWYAGDNDPKYAMNILNALYEAEKDEQLKAIIAARIQQTQGLIDLRNAAQSYKDETFLPLLSLQQLVDEGYIEQIPEDPIGLGYKLSLDGKPMLFSKVKRKAKK